MRRSITMALIALFLSSPAWAGELPVNKFVRFPEYRNALISPDGEYLALVMTQPHHMQRYELAVLKTGPLLSDRIKVTARIVLGARELFASVYWVNNTRLIAGTARYFGGFDRPYLDGTLFGIDANGGQVSTLMGVHGGGHLGSRTSGTYKMVFFAGLLSRLPQQKNDILVTGYTPDSDIPFAYNLDTVSDIFHRTATGLFGGGMLADHSGRIRFKWGINQKTGVPQLKYLPLHSGKWKDISSFVNNNKANAASIDISGPIMFGPGNKSIYFQEWSNNAARTQGLYKINMSTGEKRLLYANPIVDVGYSGQADSFIKSFDRKSLVGFRYMPGKEQTAAIDTRAPKIRLLAMLSQALPGKQVEITSWSRGGSKVVVKTWGDDQPTAFYLYSAKPKPALKLLFTATPWIKSADLSPERPIAYKSRDGLTVHGYLTLPRKHEKGKKLPLVIYVHGGPYGVRYDWGFDALDFDAVATQILANHGYAVLAPNYRGSGGYGLKFMTVGYRHWGDTMQNDLADAAEWAIKQGIADPGKICILGASYGGYAALMSAERFPDLYHCAIGYSGVYDLVELKTRASSISRYAGGRLFEKVVLGNNDKTLRAFSPVDNVGKLKVPVLLIHGGRDQRAPAHGYKEMVSAIRKHGTPLETLFYENEGHGFYKSDHRTKAWKDILAFLGKYIGAGLTAH